MVLSLNATATSNLTLDYVVSRLLNEECQGIPTISPSSALLTVHPHRSLQDITCYNCRKKGHYQS
jgi:hypothetical protein